ncbi:MAG: short chain dehydrogenase [Sandaracinus sp.]|nr:short chain dehydrogenase [Sandaracinus sp.]|tara:strand:- start:2344 stop:3126 length:783 start_codon:yes stop_codon:yes gene_type:complete
MLAPMSRLVWVTGASSGIGAAVAAAYADTGATVLASARRDAPLRALAAAHPSVVPLPLDVTDQAAVDVAVADVLKRYGGVDVLVLNAGLGQRAKAVYTDLAVDRQLMEVNYFAPVAMTKKLLPSMLARGRGHVVVVSSVVGKFGSPGRTAYSASKHALHGFYDGLRAEVYPDGLRVTLVCPGYVRTEFSLTALHGDGSAHGVMDPGQEKGLAPEEVAQAILRGVREERNEVLVGGVELAAVHAKRFVPGLFERLLRGRGT